MSCRSLVLYLAVVLVSVGCEHYLNDYTTPEPQFENVVEDKDDAIFSDFQNEPVVYDAFFGKPVTRKRSNYLSGVVNGTAPAEDGSELPSTRLLRTTLLADGYETDHDFSILSTHVFVFSFVDNVDLFYLLRYTILSDYCLNNQIRNMVNPQCIAIPVPQDDPYLSQTDIRCLNLTRVETYQDFGCLPRSLPDERYNRVTPLLDLSIVYGNTKERNDAIRQRQGGLLQFRMEGNREVPAGQSPFCFENKLPETACYNYGDDFQGNLLPGIFLTAMWFFREHNRLARKLSFTNPCWDDEKLFQVARQINIAQWQHIFYYELVGVLLGRKNALAEGIIYDTHKHVNDFDSKFKPGVFREYVIASRWFHTYQPALFDLYRNGRYVGSRMSVNDGSRSGILQLNNTEGDLTEGSTTQPADGFDYIVDPDLVERVIGDRQAASDLSATDLSRGRDAGLPPYNRYRKLCGMKVATKWEDFWDTITKDRVEKLRRLYDSVDDVELMVAIYSEKLLPNAYVGPTLYCIMVQNLLLWRKSDRFFFEHGGFPAALTEAQLYQVKQHSIARILCDNGDGIREIQPQAMLRRKIWNAPVACREIKGADLMAWKDHRCYPSYK